nr:immunoglobulin light chain junction region [Macaca mulatta]MOY14726.1 immunoglobulin light chain junction region [Macaca mulatta]MOY14747.1 immunoglobulin light chain junction region [Macaca mulatta]MOY14858.1 immunoglobulin light chain junction region [Macaca mulatta]MOY14879.1 immunoglobulin light chain junction region [Macaca mulatta]
DYYCCSYTTSSTVLF